MLRVPNSLVHRNEKLLCNNFSERTQTVNRSSLGYLSDPQYPQVEPGSVGIQHASHPNLASMMPVAAPGMGSRMTYSMQPSVVGYYATPVPECASHPLQFAGYYPTADIGLPTATYDSYTHTSQPLDIPAYVGGMFHDHLVAPQPPTPPAASGTSGPQNPCFQYHPCQWLGGPQCDGSAPGKNREMAEHLRVYHHFVGHERDTVPCEWESCGQVMQRMNVARHIVSRHLLAAANCRYCGKQFSRPDVVARHERSCSEVHSV